MELLLLKVLGDALPPDPIEIVASNGPIAALLAAVVAGGVFAIRFFFRKKKQVRK